MKYYATTENSRGKRDGVGDNKFLKLELSKGNKREFSMTYDDTGITIINHLTLESISIDTKGKNKKGEKVRCNNCYWTTKDEDVAQCPNCKTDSFLMDL